MKVILPLFLILVLSSQLFGQKEKYDLAVYAPPNGWTKNQSQDFISYNFTDNAKGTYCTMAIYKSAISKGTNQADFDYAWQDLIVRYYKPTIQPRPEHSPAENGWEALAGASPFEFNGTDVIAMLVTITGHGRCVNIVVLMNSENYQSDIVQFLESMEMEEPANSSPAAMVMNTSNANSGTVSVVGAWGKSNAVGQLYNSYGSYSYNKQQYIFNSNGTYTFLGKTYSEKMDETLLTKETGSYSLKGNVLTVNPQVSTIEAWSKKNGGDNWNQLKSSQQIALEQRTYRANIVNNNLELQSDKETARDGKFNHDNVYTYGPPGTFTPIALPGQ